MNSAGVSEERSRNYIRQVKGSIVFRAGAVAASFFTLPLMIHYLGRETYGVWSTLLGIVSWISFFDLGIGNGLRNKVAEALASGNDEEAGKYIASAYSLIGLIVCGLIIVAIAVSFAVPWQSVFNTRMIPEDALRDVVILTFLIIAANFWVGLINQVLNAVQKTSVVGFGQLLANAAALLGLYVLVSVSAHASLFLMAAVYGLSLIAANALLSVWFYRKRRELMPSIALRRDHIQPLLSLGTRFFVIQCAVLVIYTTDKILVTQLLGPQYVAQYDVVFKLFGLLTMGYSIISAPLWSAYTDAYHRGDTTWIESALRQQLLFFVGISAGAVVMVLVAKPVIALWIGKDIGFSMALVLSMAAFTVVSVWNNVFAFVVNGIGEIGLQMKTAIVGMVANIPLSILLVKWAGLGVEGVVWATALSLTPFALLAPFQVRSLLQGKISETA